MQIPQTRPFPASASKAALLRLPQVLALYPVSRSTWWQGVKTRRFPQPVKISARCTAWRTSDIEALIQATAGDR